MKSKVSWFAVVVVAVAPVLGCGSTPTEEEQAPGVFDEHALAQNLPWTTRFESEAALVAERIRIEGPPDLIEHFALRQAPDVFTFDTKTTSAGLLQTARMRTEVVGGVTVPVAGEIRVHLDQWTIVAMRELVCLSRPGDVPVVVVAEGEVAFLPAGAEIVRDARMEFRGTRGDR